MAQRNEGQEIIVMTGEIAEPMNKRQTAAGDMQPTPTGDALPRRFADFATLGEALDYAATGERGLNFHDARGTLTRPYPFRELRDDALAQAHRLIAAGVKPGERIALIAETGPDFASLFFGVVYAGYPHRVWHEHVVGAQV